MMSKECLDYFLNPTKESDAIYRRYVGQEEWLCCVNEEQGDIFLQLVQLSEEG